MSQLAAFNAADTVGRDLAWFRPEQREAELEKFELRTREFLEICGRMGAREASLTAEAARHLAGLRAAMRRTKLGLDAPSEPQRKRQ
jgi:hypothetical protein